MTQPTLPVAAGAGINHLSIDDESLEIIRTVWNRCLPEALDAAQPPAVVVLADYWKDSGEMPSGRSDAVVGDVTATAIDAGIGHRVMFHAAGLSDPESRRTIALVAPSGTGKTTAVAALGSQFGYVTDETVIIDPDSLAITPFPKPLSILGPSGQRPKTLFSPDELGLMATPQNPTLGAVVVLARDPDHDDAPHLERLTLADALGHLVPQTSSLAALDRGLATLAGVVDRVGGCHLLRYREIHTVGPLLEKLLAAEPVQESPAWSAVELPVEGRVDEPANTSTVPDGWVQRATAQDVLALPDVCLAVLVDSNFMVLQGLGPVIWESLDQPTPLDTLVDQLASHPEAPEEAEQMVRDAVAQLAERGVLLLDPANAQGQAKVLGQANEIKS